MQPNKLPEIIIPHRITRSFIKNHKEFIFVYSADVVLNGALGQMWEAHGEENAFPVFVMWKPCKSSGFFQGGSQACEIIKLNAECISRIVKASAPDKPIIPFPKIGEGNSRMKEFSPESYRWLKDKLDEFAYPNIRIDYAT